MFSTLTIKTILLNIYLSFFMYEINNFVILANFPGVNFLSKQVMQIQKDF